ncbi:hypothetical protein PCANB_000581 [Pneumocystis canis]|nr:hypothetical protein PCANB_000581 [Pneumocystis canis]
MATLDLIRSKFATLNSGSQEEITSVSSWVLFHRRNAKQIVETWMQSLKDASALRKLNLIYLANDVTQQSKARKREEFVNAFSTVIAEAMENAYLHGTQDVQNRLKHVANVWEQRNVFSENVIMDINKRLELAEKSIKKSLSGNKIGGILKSSLVPELTMSASPLYASKLFQLLESFKLSYSTSKAAIVVREDIIKQLELLLKENNSMLVKENEQLNEIQKKIDHINDMKQQVEKMITNILETSEDENSTLLIASEKKNPLKDDQVLLYEDSNAFTVTNDAIKTDSGVLNLETVSILSNLKNMKDVSSFENDSNFKIT